MMGVGIDINVFVIGLLNVVIFVTIGKCSICTLKIGEYLD